MSEEDLVFLPANNTKNWWENLAHPFKEGYAEYRQYNRQKERKRIRNRYRRK